MRSVIVAALFLACAASGMRTIGHAQVKSATAAPSFCNGINCPKFQTLKTCSGFEIRKYPREQWVGSNWYGPGYTAFDKSGGEGFQKGFSYISGANVGNKKIDMTCPVLTKVEAGAGPNCNTSLTVAFFIPFKYQGTAPAPTNPNTFLFEQEELTVAVASFGGYTNDFKTEVAPKLKELGTSLMAANITFSQKDFWVADYDSPFRIFDRHNEVWFAVPADSQC
jgi:hypothetical protein